MEDRKPHFSDIEQRAFEKICNEYGNQMIYSVKVDFKKKKKKTSRILVVGSYMLFLVMRNKDIPPSLPQSIQKELKSTLSHSAGSSSSSSQSSSSSSASSGLGSSASSTSSSSSNPSSGSSSISSSASSSSLSSSTSATTSTTSTTSSNGTTSISSNRATGGKTYKLDQALQLLDLRSVNTSNFNRRLLTLKFAPNKEGKEGAILEFLTDYINEIIRAIRSAVRLFTNGFPNQRLPALFGAGEESLLALAKVTDDGPAKGFLHTYQAYCCYSQVTASREIMQYVRDMASAGVTEFCLHDCPGIDQKGTCNVAPITSALRFNTYFRSLSAIHLSRKDILYHCSHVFRHNTHISKLVLSQLPEGNLTELFDALYCNRNNVLQILDLSGTHIHKGSSSLCFALKQFSHGLRVLKLADTGLDGRQVANIMLGLSGNFGMSLTIEELDLSNNKFDDVASGAFEHWLSKAAEYSNLQVLRVAHTGISLSTVAAYFHFLKFLRLLDVSGNKPDSRAVQLLCSMAEKSTSLRELNLSQCNLSGRNAAAITIALFTNRALTSSILNLSSNEFAESDAEVLASALSHAVSLHTLDLSRNRFKERGLIGVLMSVIHSACPLLDSLILNGMYRTSLPGERVSSALMSVVNSLPSLQSLSLSGGFGASTVIPLLQFLHTNTTLVELDISNNLLGDEGAFAVSELLRHNTALLSLKCDGNNISPTGWKMVLASFMQNHTLSFIDLPWNDYAKWATNLPDDKLRELRAVLIDIQRALQTANSADPRFSRFMPPPAVEAPVDLLPLCPIPKKLRQISDHSMSSLAVDKVSSPSQNPPVSPKSSTIPTSASSSSLSAPMVMGSVTVVPVSVSVPSSGISPRNMYQISGNVYPQLIPQHDGSLSFSSALPSASSDLSRSSSSSSSSKRPKDSKSKSKSSSKTSTSSQTSSSSGPSSAITSPKATKTRSKGKKPKASSTALIPTKKSKTKPKKDDDLSDDDLSDQEDIRAHNIDPRDRDYDPRENQTFSPPFSRSPSPSPRSPSPRRSTGPSSTTSSLSSEQTAPINGSNSAGTKGKEMFVIAASSDESSYDYLTDYEDSDDPEFETPISLSQYPSAPSTTASDSDTDSGSEASGSQMSGSVDEGDDDDDPILSSDEDFDV